MLRGAEPREILQTIIEKKTPVVMSYLSRGKWYAAKVLLTGLGAKRLHNRYGQSGLQEGTVYRNAIYTYAL